MSFTSPTKYPLVDLRALTRDVGIDFDAVVRELLAYYADIDQHNEHNLAHLNLPCRSGCEACCHEPVFLTPIEFMTVWDWVQSHMGGQERDAVIEAGLALYEEHREAIQAFDVPPPAGEKDHFLIAKELHFRCPLLGEGGACSVYPVRELSARLFGASFNEGGGVYGCELVGKHLAGQTVTLVSAERASQGILELPFGNKRQVYPYYIHMMYTDPNVPVITGSGTAKS